MPGRIFFRDARGTVTSAEVIIGKQVFPLTKILSVYGVRRRSILPLLQPSRFALVITTPDGEREVLRERNGYVVFQLAKAIETALREQSRKNGAAGVRLTKVSQPAQPGPSANIEA
jgi:hypothetical protein